ncbi:MAG: FeoA family protein [Erysipelotrichaceae bacterium]|nr:FeoA family protein [Erysipelotrichaceae bacterium]
MPLIFASMNTPLIVKDVKGQDKQIRFLQNLGFVKGANIQVVNKNGNNLIVNVKDTRVALGKDIANKILVYGDDYENIERY